MALIGNLYQSQLFSVHRQNTEVNPQTFLIALIAFYSSHSALH